MSSRESKFFLGRVIKLGILNKDMFIEALRDSEGVTSRKYKWLITETHHNTEGDFEYFYGKLTKYDPVGETKVIDEGKKLIKDDLTLNLEIASSPFVYIPELSGIAYLKVWSQIDEDTFKGRIKDIIIEYSKGFFVDLEINDISETLKFQDEVKKIEKVTVIDCVINKPNPLYGDIWKSLKEYLVRRNSKELTIREEGKNAEGINTSLNESEKLDIDKMNLSDAAVYMALDGYGKATVKGYNRGKEVEVKTNDSVVSFRFRKDASHKELALKVYKILEKINKKRGLKH